MRDVGNEGAVSDAVERGDGDGLVQLCQQRRLREGQLLGGGVEVVAGSRLDAVGAGAEIDAVQVEREDLVLVELGLQPDREGQLLQLAGERALRRQKSPSLPRSRCDGRPVRRRVDTVAGQRFQFFQFDFISFTHMVFQSSCKDNAFFVNYKKQIRIRLIFLIPV